MIQRHMPAALRAMPDFVQRYVLHFEASIEDAVRGFAVELPAGSRVLDAGAGEGQYAEFFKEMRYTGVDLGIGDTNWLYRNLDVIGDLRTLPFADGIFEGCINIVTLEHVIDPAGVLSELCRVLEQKGRLLLVTPLEWEEHQQPHDYYRYTRYALHHLLSQSGFEPIRIEPVGGYFRLLGRRLLNGLQFFPGLAGLLAAAVLVPAGIAAPAFDRLDQTRNFTLGHICTAYKR